MHRHASRRAVLVAQDEYVKRACWRALAASGYQVGLHGLEDVPAEFEFDPDIVILDASDQPQRGLDLLGRLRETAPRSLLLAVIAETLDAAIAARRGGADGVIAHSVDGRRLTDRTSATMQQVLTRVETGIQHTPGPVVELGGGRDRGEPDGGMPRPRRTAVGGGDPKAAAAAPAGSGPNEGEGLHGRRAVTVRDPATKVKGAPDAPATAAAAAASASRATSVQALHRHDDLLLRQAVRLNAATGDEVEIGIEELLVEVGARVEVELLLAFVLSGNARAGVRALAGCRGGVACDRVAVTQLAHELELTGLIQRMVGRQTVYCRTPHELPPSEASLHRALLRMGLGPMAAMPLVARGRAVGFLLALRRTAASSWDGAAVRCLEITADLLAGAVERRAQTSVPVPVNRSSAEPSELLLPAAAAGVLARQLDIALSTLEADVRLLVEGDGRSRRDDAGAVSRAAERARSLAAQLRIFDPSASGGSELIHLNDFAVESAALLQALLGDAIPVPVAAEATSPWTQCDPMAVRRLLARIALLCVDGSGVARVVLRTSEPEAAATSGLWLEIALLGAAIGAETASGRPLIHAVKAAALIAEAHAAGLHLTRVDAGPELIFRLSLPRRRQRDASRRTSQLVKPRPTQRARVLVVEDEPTLRRMVARVISRLGHDVQEASSAEEALELALLPGEPLALLVTDVCLPHRTGPSLARELRSDGRVRSLLFMSGYADASAISAEFGTDVSLLAKPFRQHDLTARVQALLDAA